MIDVEMSPAVRWLRPSDMEGLARLGVDGVVGITHTVEGMHRAIATLGRRDGRARGITGFAYEAVRQTARALGGGLGHLLRRLPQEQDALPSRRREAFVSACN